MSIERFQYLDLLFRVNTGQNSLYNYIGYFHTLLNFNAYNCVYILQNTRKYYVVHDN